MFLGGIFEVGRPSKVKNIQTSNGETPSPGETLPGTTVQVEYWPMLNKC
jgi:hypothetical protein